MGLEELEDQLDIHFPEGDYETIAGFVLYYLGHFPLQGEHFQYEGIKIEIIEMDGMKIDKLKVQRIF